MGVDGGVARRSRQVLTIAVGDVFSGLGITEALGQAKVNHIDVVLLFADSNQEIVRLDITVQKVARMHEFDALQLYREQKEPCEFSIILSKTGRSCNSLLTI